jgi:hypothetical protein
LSAEKLSADEQKVLAIVKSSENYENLSASLSPVFSEINELYASGNIKKNLWQRYEIHANLLRSLVIYWRIRMSLV